MRFADPQACPDCRGAIAGHSTCPQCGLDLTMPEVRQLWQTLLQADELLARATSRRDQAGPVVPPTAPTQPTPPRAAPAPAAPQAPPPPTPSADPYASFPTGPQPSPAPPRERRWSVGTILLTLGAFGLIVAGFIFVTRSWGDLGLVGRTLVLMGVTAVFVALGIWVTRRPLRASAEAVWTIVLALLTLDFFAARHEGMLGLGGMSIAWAWAVWGTVAVGLAILISLFSRPHVKADLIAPAIAGGIGITIGGIGAANVPPDGSLAWRSILALVVAGLLALATRPAGLRPMTLTARIVTAGFFVWAYAVAFFELVDHPALDELVGDGRGGPLALMAVAAMVIAWLVHQVRIPAVALAVVAVSGLVIAPAAAEWEPEGFWLALAVLASLLAMAAARGTDDWARGVRVGAIPVIVSLAALPVALLADVGEALGRAGDTAWSGAWDGRVDSQLAEDTAPWVVPIVLAALLVVAWFVPRWPELAKVRPHAWSVLAVVGGVGVIDAVVVARLPLWSAVAVVVLAAAALLVVHLRVPSVLLAGPASAVLTAAASLLAASHQGVSAAAWIVGALVLAGLALAKGPVELRHAYAVGGVGLGVAGLSATADLLDPPHAVPALVAVITSLALVAAAGLRWRDHPVRLSVEAAAGFAGFVALVTEGPSGELAVRWTIAGVALIALSFVVPQRRWYLWPGGVALVVAYVLLIVDSGFSFVEAYTLPLGAIALAVGLYAARRQPQTSTWLLLGPGLAIALLPSVPQALADPTELRALLLGLGAIVALALGIRLGWQAPFVSGTVILVLLVLFNIGPYANAAPRVVLIAVVSAILLGVGITWEDRVRDGRKLVGYVRSMR